MTVPDNQNGPAAFAAGSLQRVEKTHFAFVGGVEDAAPYKCKYRFFDKRNRQRKPAVPP